MSSMIAATWRKVQCRGDRRRPPSWHSPCPVEGLSRRVLLRNTPTTAAADQDFAAPCW